MASVLVIDDDDGMRMMVRRMLEAAGHEVVEASNGVEGLERFRDRRPALVVTDILMPDKDGLETVRELLAADPQARVIVVSGGNRVMNMSFLQVAKAFGAAETIAKPFRREELLAAVERVLERR